MAQKLLLKLSSQLEICKGLKKGRQKSFDHENSPPNSTKP